MSISRQRQRLFGLLLLVACSGCEEEVGEEYGHRSHGNSVNGVSVLSECFEQAGHRVRSWRRLSPSLEKADVIVWFPDRFEPPSREVVEWLQDWLQYDPRGVQLIMVGRDYSAGEYYWSTVAPKALQKDKAMAKQKAKEATTRFKQRRRVFPKDQQVEGWFSVDGTTKQYQVKRLSGPWANGVDAKKANLKSGQVYEPADNFEILLADGQGHPLVSERIFNAEDTDWAVEDSKFTLIENGSFLLNASLVNHEHRKLAMRLVESIGEEKRQVVFLESGPLDPPISEDPSREPPVGMKLFTVWPIGAVLAQLAAFGIIFAVMRWPVFGVARQLERPELTNFGRHIRAIGSLLADTEDRNFAFGQIAAYFKKGATSYSAEKPAEDNIDNDKPNETAADTTPSRIVNE